MTHTLEIDGCYIRDILLGIKRFEIRANDREFKIDDIILFHPVNIPDWALELEFVIKDIDELKNTRFRISFIPKDGYGLAEGYTAFGFEKCY